MATIQELETALINSDKAGDIEASKVLANEIIKLREQSQQPRQQQELSSNTWDMYFNNKLSPEDRISIENQIKAGQIKLPLNITSNISSIPTSPERPQETGVTLQKEYTPLEKIQAGLQSAGTMITGATTGALGNIAGATTGIIDSMLQGTFGTQQGAKQAQKTAEEMTQAGTYQPDNQLSQQYTQNVAGALEPLTTIAPMDLGIVQGAKLAREIPVPKAGDILQGKQQAIQEAGITPMTTDIAPPTTAIGKVAQSIGEKIPFTGTGIKRAEQQGQRVQAIKDTMQEFGYTDGENVINNVTKDLLNKRSNEISKYSTMKKDIFNKIDETTGAKVDTSKTIGTIDEEINKIKDLGLAENDKAIATLEDFKNAFQDKNINQIEDLRKALGNKLNDEGLTSVKNILEKSSFNIYKTLNEDLGSHIKNFGDRNDFIKWQVANKRLSSSIGELNVNSLKNVLDKGSDIPETVNKMLFSKNKSEQDLLFKNLSNEGKDNARIAIINKIMGESGLNEEGGLSTAKFISSLKRNDIPINTFFKGKDLEKIKGLNRALQLTKQAEIAGVVPSTGVQLLMPTVFTSLGAATGSTAAGIGAGLGVGLLARAYESQPVSNLLIKLGKAPKAQETQLFKLLNDNVNKALQIENLTQQGDNNQ